MSEYRRGLYVGAATAVIGMIIGISVGILMFRGA